MIYVKYLFVSPYQTDLPAIEKLETFLNPEMKKLKKSILSGTITHGYYLIKKQLIFHSPTRLVYHNDQDLRRQMDDVIKKHDWESEEMEALKTVGKHNDSINIIKIQKILDEHGWLGREVIGRQGNLTLFLVIQHADLAVQEKYLPMMRDAVAKGNASAGSLAMLEDRVAIRKEERQIYSSQVKRDPKTGTIYILHLRDPDNIDQRRAEVGLGPLKEYASRFGIEWDVEKYKEELPGLVEMLRN